MEPFWNVHKFGGTSVANAERYRKVADILTTQPRQGQRLAAVVSAMSKVTDELIALAEGAVTRDESYPARFNALKHRHLDTIAELSLSEIARQELIAVIEGDCKDLGDILRGVWIA